MACTSVGRQGVIFKELIIGNDPSSQEIPIARLSMEQSLSEVESLEDEDGGSRTTLSDQDLDDDEDGEQDNGRNKHVDTHSPTEVDAVDNDGTVSSPTQHEVNDRASAIASTSEAVTYTA